MKKFYYLLASIVLFIGVLIACVNPSIEADELQALEKTELQAKGADKSDICHWDADLGEYFVINIADAAYDKHLAHGDKPIPTFYKDADGDGFGNPNSIFEGTVCDAPKGYVLDNTDCDDTKPNFIGDYTIYRENGQELIISIDSEGTITGYEPKYKYELNGKLLLFESNYVMLIWQKGFNPPAGYGPYDLSIDMWGRHEISGFVLTECDGFDQTTNLRDYYGGDNKDDYSWTTSFD